MHIVREDGCDYILVGLGECTSTQGFGNESIRKGDKVRLVIECWRSDVIHIFESWSYNVRALGFDYTWGEAGIHYKLEYVYPYMANQEEKQHER